MRFRRWNHRQLSNLKHCHHQLKKKLRKVLKKRLKNPAMIAPMALLPPLALPALLA